MNNHVCALEWRYGSDEMRKLLSRDNIVKVMVEVEKALLYGLAKAGIVPKEVINKLDPNCFKVDPEEVYMLEAKIGHEVAALAMILSKRCGEAGKYIHLGATSNDIIDTAWAIILRSVFNILKVKMKRLIEILTSYAVKYKDVIMIGRTHGQHALPITLGFKFANYAYELTRSLERLMECEKRVVRGKISGAVGTMAAWGDKGFQVERYTLEILNLKPHVISTQVAPRDGIAEFTLTLSIIASQLDRLALEVRELMRTEIGELTEATKPIGSSTMPHKSNPVTSEKVSGLARLVRGLTVSALENIVLWHERDLTNSSCERLLLPHIILIVDEMLESTIKVMEGLRVFKDRMMENLRITKGINMSEAIVVKLVEKGMSRLEAYNLVKEVITRSVKEGLEFKNALLSDERIRKFLTAKEIEECLNPKNYLGSTSMLIDRTVEYVKEVTSRVT